MHKPLADPLLGWSGATPGVTCASGSRIAQIRAGRFPSSARYTYVSIRTAGMARARVPAALPGMVSRRAGNIALGTVAVTGIVRLLAERQLRATLIALMRNAPPPTVVVQDDKDTGQFGPRSGGRKRAAVAARSKQ